MWETARDKVNQNGGAVHMDRRVVRIEHDGSAVTAFVAADAPGATTRYHGRALPLDPADSRPDPRIAPSARPPEILAAAEA